MSSSEHLASNILWPMWVNRIGVFLYSGQQYKIKTAPVMGRCVDSK